MASLEQTSAPPPPSQPMLSVVIPLHGEGSHFKQSFREIRRHLESTPCGREVVLVDDGSTDETWEVIRELADEHEYVTALRLSRNFGKEGAIVAGLDHTNGDAVIVMDGDLQHPPGLIPEMYRLWRDEGIEIVNAVKASRGKEGPFRKLGARAFSVALNSFSGFDMTGATDFKLLDRRVVDALSRMSETQSFYRGMVAWLGFKHAEISFDVGGDLEKESAWSSPRLIIFALTALTAFTSAPLQIVTALGALLVVLGIGLASRSVYLWLSGAAVTGFTTVILLQLIIGGCVMISLGIIGHYISNIYLEVKRRPRYVLAESITESPRRTAD